MVPEIVDEIPELEGEYIQSEEKGPYEEQRRERLMKYLLEKQSSHGSLVTILDEKRQARETAYDELKANQPSYEKTARNVLLGVLRKNGIEDPNGLITALERNDPEAFAPGKKRYQELRNLKIYKDPWNDEKIDFATGLRRMNELGITFKTDYLSDYNFIYRIRDFASISEEHMNEVLQTFDACEFLYRDILAGISQNQGPFFGANPFMSSQPEEKPPERGSNEYFSYLGGWISLLRETDQEKLRDTAAIARRMWDLTQGKCFSKPGEYYRQYNIAAIDTLPSLLGDSEKWRVHEMLLEEIYFQNPQLYEQMVASESFGRNFFDSLFERDFKKTTDILSQTISLSVPTKREQLMDTLAHTLSRSGAKRESLYQSVSDYLTENDGIPQPLREELLYGMFSNEINGADAYSDMFQLLRIGSEEHISDSLRHVILSKIVAQIQVHKLSDRADIEVIERNVSEILKSKAYLEMPEDIDRFLFQYIMAQLPIGLTGDVINDVRNTGLDLSAEGFELKTDRDNNNPLEWAHQSLHNYPTPQNVALFHAFSEFIHAQTQEEREAAGIALEAIAVNLNQLARPDVKQLLAIDPEKLRTTTEGLVKKAEDGLEELYTPSFTLLSGQLASIQEYVPDDSYDAITTALQHVEIAAKDTTMSEVEVCHEIMGARKIIKKLLHQIPGDVIPILCAADRALDMAGYSVIPKAIQQLRAQFQEEPFNRDAAVAAVRLETSMTGLLKVIGVNLSEEGEAIKALKRLGGDITDPYLPSNVMMQRLEATAQKDKLGYEKGWLSASEQFTPAVIQELIAKQIQESGKQRNEVTQEEYDDFYRHAVDEARGNTSNIIERTSTLFPIRLGLDELRELVGQKNREQTQDTAEEAAARVKDEINEIIHQGKEEVAQTYKQETTTESLPEDVAAFINERFSSQGNLDPLSPEFTNELTDISQSSYARAYRLLQLMEGKNGELDEEALRQKGYYLAKVDGIPLLIIKKDKKFSKDPYKDLTIIYKPVQAAINFTRHEGD